MIPDADTSAVTQDNEPVRTRLVFMRQLLASLSASRKALLGMDLAAIEQGTREQSGLSRVLAEMVRSRRLSVIQSCTSTQEHAAGLVCDSDPGGELKRTESEVMQALRLQSALLARVQRKMRVMANMLADPSLNYGPWLAQSVGLPHASDATRGQQI